LAKRRFEKLFTPEEANGLIPQLEASIRGLQLEVEALRAQVRELAREDSDVDQLPLLQLVERYPTLKANASRMADLASQIEGLGCFLKDIEMGLVDFPCEVEDDVVFLCWQFGEREIVAWHSVESGFADRRPLPGASKPFLN
jgi:hypothetical protein